MPCSVWLYSLLLLATGLVQELTAGAITQASGAQHETPSGCLMPPQPIGGSYTLNFCTGSSCDILPWTQVSPGSMLTYKCNEGYIQKGGNFAFCTNSIWFGSPTCVKTCSAPGLEGIDAFCNYQGKNVTCNFRNDPGTKATLACKDFYRILRGDDPASQEITCLKEGVWSHTNFRCIPECGTAVADGDDLNVNGSQVKHSSFPWHVAIYKRSSVGNFEQICAGTLISPNSVISAAHCFYNESTRRLMDGSEFSIVAGKYYRPYSTKEPQAQESPVREIAITERYLGLGRKYEQDIAILRLETPFILTMFVKPVCMDWNNRQEIQQLQTGTTGKAVWWGKIVDGNPNTGLHGVDLPYVPFRSCLAAISKNFKGFTTLDKFCAGHLNGSRPGDGDSGGGLHFHLDGLWFLRGITGVVSPPNGMMAENNSYTAFTNVGRFIDWIRDVFLSPGNEQSKLSPYSRNASTIELPDGSIGEESALHLSNASSIRGCILPEQPTGGSFDLDLCGDAGERVSIGSVLVYRCEDGYTLKGNNVSICYANVWNPPTTCVKACPALKSTSVDIVYKYRGEIISPVAAIVPGTKATLTCKNLYKIPPEDDPAYREITCLEEGVWDRPLFRCLPECGTPKPRGNPLNPNESTVGRSFPWYVGIYKRSSTGTFEQICAGTLISSHLVVSAARCFYDEVAGRVIDASFFEVTAGKNYLFYNVSEPHAQNSPVQRIDVAERYIGSIGNHAGDIALLLLEKPFNMTPWVEPVCMDWGNEYEMEQLRKGKSGKTSKRSMTGMTRNELDEMSYPYIPYQECVAGASEEFVSFVTADKFCAGYANGANISEINPSHEPCLEVSIGTNGACFVLTAVQGGVHVHFFCCSGLCDDQNGSGLYFESDRLWYLRGIATVQPGRAGDTGNDNNYRTFTNVASFVEEIRTTYLNTGSQSVGRLSPLHDASAPTRLSGPTATSSTSGCILPSQPTNGRFALVSCEGQCNFRNQPGTKVPIDSVLLYSCNEGYEIRGTNVTTCHDIGWNRIPVCQGIKNCSALSSKTVDFECHFLGKSVSCGNSIIPGTEVTLACKNSYRILPNHDPGYRKTTCLQDGTWDRTVFQCIPDCSRAVAGGKRTWDVHVYLKDDDGSFLYLHKGTLVSPGLVITNSGWDPTERKKSAIASNWAVVAGASTTSYDTVGPHVQKSLVRRVDLATGHGGETENFYVMALLYLDSPFIMTAQVNPICLDWYKDIGVPAVTADMIPYEKCIPQVHAQFMKYVTSDTFCNSRCALGGQMWGTNRWSWEYKSGGVWYLWGYLIGCSSGGKNKCSNHCILTSVRHHQDWIWSAYNRTG